MSIRSDIEAYLTDYRGIFGWYSFTEPFTGDVRPKIEIPLYLKESAIPLRALKTTEISTVATKDPGTGKSTTTNVVFFGAPDLLQVQVSGWTITPLDNSGKWNPVDASGTPLGWGPLSYNDIIRYFIAGKFNRDTAGSWQRTDPSYYISPRGQQYPNPIIQIFQPQATPTMKKQAFDMTIYLEK